MLFDWLVVGQILPFNPAGSLRVPCGRMIDSATIIMPWLGNRQYTNIHTVSVDRLSHFLGARVLKTFYNHGFWV